MMGPWALRLGGPEPRGPHGVGAYDNEEGRDGEVVTCKVVIFKTQETSWKGKGTGRMGGY